MRLGASRRPSLHSPAVESCPPSCLMSSTTLATLSQVHAPHLHLNSTSWQPCLRYMLHTLISIGWQLCLRYMLHTLISLPSTNQLAALSQVHRPHLHLNSIKQSVDSSVSGACSTFISTPSINQLAALSQVHAPHLHLNSIIPSINQFATLSQVYGPDLLLDSINQSVYSLSSGLNTGENRQQWETYIQPDLNVQRV